MKTNKILLSKRSAFFFLLTLILVVNIIYECVSYADEGEDEEAGQIVVLDKIVVVGKVESHAIGKTVVDKEMIKTLPKSNGSLNEMLKVSPGIQFSEDYMNSAQGGEILPPSVSISGGKSYQNNFVIDGISNNSLLDPANSDHKAKNDVSGHAQQIFLDADLIEEIRVYDSNVPAEYGNFTGGVVDVDTIKPADTLKGKFNFRMTSSDWTEFYLEEDSEDSNSEDIQPEFDKYMAGIMLNIPVNDHSGIVTDYKIFKSIIPLQHLGGSKSQERITDSFFLKYNNDITDRNSIDFSFAYTPYTGKYFRKNALNSDYEISGGGFVLKSDYTKMFSTGELLINTSFRKSENSRSGQDHFKSWKRTNTKQWGRYAESDYSKEGGYGDIDKEQEDYDLTLSYDLNKFKKGLFSHNLKAGLLISKATGSYNRKTTTYEYYDPVTGPNIQGNPDLENNDDYVKNEQYFRSRYIYEKNRVNAEINQLNFYLQDEIIIKRLRIHPGFRFSYDDYMKNYNIEPRFSAEYDIFESGATVLSGGVNRYYGRTLLTYKLREGILPRKSQYRTIYRNILQDWQDSSGYGTNSYKYSELDTPYTDEYSISIDQELFGGTLGLKYVNRKGKDEFTKVYGPVMADGLRYYELDNSGTTDYWSVRLNWSRTWGNHFLFINSDYQETNTSNEDYNTNLEDEEERVYYNGHIVYRDELPRSDYNRPLVVNLTYVVKLPWGFSFSNFTKYRFDYENLTSTGEYHTLSGSEVRYNPVTGEAVSEEIPIYEKIKFDPSIVFDWKVSWQKTLYRRVMMDLHIDINNIFNEKIETGKKGVYGTGRQFWIGAEFNF